MAKKNKFYVVWVGAKTGIFATWDECKAQVHGFEGAKYKSYESLAEAQKAFGDAHSTHIVMAGKPKPQNTGVYERESLAVDAACSGNPGAMEYRGVLVASGEEMFHIGPLAQGTNNVGEFLALVHGLAFLKKQDSTLPIYSDSKIALGWIAQKKCKTKLERTPRNTEIFKLIERAEIWLHNNSYKTKLYKWETEDWGEIPADFGRK
jgi:ribonuclease HI